MRILIADDERIMIELLEDMLSSHKVVSAMDGREAIKKYIELKPDYGVNGHKNASYGWY